MLDAGKSPVVLRHPALLIGLALTPFVPKQRICSSVLEGGHRKSWNLKGSYVETCSCELMCPRNLSLDHGATYDFCRVTLVFNIGDGEIEGTDVSGLKVAAIADTPKVMTEGELATRSLHRRERDGRAG